jgi:hypothetical protein
MAVSRLQPLGGANDFTLDIGSGGNTTFYLAKEYSPGAYSITSQLADSSLDIYAINADGTLAGYTSTKAFTATKGFNKVVVYGATTNDLLQFSYKTTYSPSNKGELSSGSAPYLISVSVSNLTTIDDSTVLTGGNFNENMSIIFTGTDNIPRNAKSVIVSSSTSALVIRPDDLPADHAPYTLSASNPGIPDPSINVHKLVNAISSGTKPTWTTTSLPMATVGSAYSYTLVATDTEQTDMDYSIVSGSLPTGLALDSETGIISGTVLAHPTLATTTQTINFRATDAGGNYLDKQLTIFWAIDVDNATAADIASSYPLLYILATNATKAFNNVTKMQNYGSQITTTLTNSGKATNAGAWGQGWPFDISQGPTEGKIFVGLNGSDDGDSNTQLYQLNESGQTQVYNRTNTSFSDQNGPVVFRGARLVMGGGSVGSMYVSNVWTLTAP